MKLRIVLLVVFAFTAIPGFSQGLNSLTLYPNTLSLRADVTHDHLSDSCINTKTQSKAGVKFLSTGILNSASQSNSDILPGTALKNAIPNFNPYPKCGKVGVDAQKVCNYQYNLKFNKGSVSFTREVQVDLSDYNASHLNGVSVLENDRVLDYKFKLSSSFKF